MPKNNTAKTIVTIFIGVLLLIGAVYLVFALTQADSSSSSDSTDLSKLDWYVPDFTYTNQDGKPFGLSDLKGHVWLTDMIFTNCRTVCPPMTANMAQLQQKLKEKGVEVDIVSFSVDPERDTPDALKAYGEKFGADFSQWHFLTGYSPEQIEELSYNTFKATLQKEENSDQVIHVTTFYLVDKSGKIVRKYDGLNPPYDTIIKDIKAFR
ncbi:SCO family protein [Brevibacillus massiliensis]|uniref:SCO family protein n=1 Tax=Brevibacillus massiliensis TaxID=1118054 RepID=UPI0003827C67|nr:SCO family protein [Brevibacillus massiliensis]